MEAEDTHIAVFQRRRVAQTIRLSHQVLRGSQLTPL